MRKQLLVRIFIAAMLVSSVLAPVAEAYNDGRGVYGSADDKVVTNAGFIVIAFFPILVFVLSMLQRVLERRKEARQAAQKALLGNSHWRGGW